MSAYYLEENNLVTKAERYTYTPYSIKKTEYARKSDLYQKPYASFAFVTEDYESATLDQFNNPTVMTTNARKLSDTGTEATETTFIYDDQHRCEMERTKLTRVIGGQSTEFFRRAPRRARRTARGQASVAGKSWNCATAATW